MVSDTSTSKLMVLPVSISTEIFVLGGDIDDEDEDEDEDEDDI